MKKAHAKSRGDFFGVQAEFVLVAESVRKMLTEHSDEHFADKTMKQLLEMSTWTPERAQEEADKAKAEFLMKILFGGAKVDV